MLEVIQISIPEPLIMVLDTREQVAVRLLGTRVDVTEKVEHVLVGEVRAALQIVADRDFGGNDG